MCGVITWFFQLLKKRQIQTALVYSQNIIFAQSVHLRQEIATLLYIRDIQYTGYWKILEKEGLTKTFYFESKGIYS
jgi:hypothetical protein